MGKAIRDGYITDTINGIKVNTSIPCNSANYNNCGSRTVTYIVMHYTGNKKDTAISNAKYFNTGSRSASAHFFVDDTSIYQSVELRDKAWHCGGTTYYHGSCRNSNSIGIEMCCTADNYKISEKTKQNAAALCAAMCKKLGIAAGNVDQFVLRHYDITHKKCPAQMVDSVAEWNAFKNEVKRLLGASASTTGGYKIDGVDYSPVFDPTYYANKYADLRAAFGTNATALFNHFKEYGMKEGRQANINFEVNIYRISNADLQNAFGNDLPAYYKHYCVYGKNENRVHV